MTTRIEFKNSHTNTETIRIREVRAKGDKVVPVEGPAPLILAPGQNGARRMNSASLLLVDTVGADGEKPRVPDTPPEAGIETAEA